MAMTWIWTGMVAFSLLFGLLSGNLDAVANAALEGAQAAMELSLSMAGILCLWSGVMEVMNVCGLSAGLARIFRPLLRRLLPDASRDAETLAAVSANVSANFLGLGNAATPFGMKAMQEMQALNDKPDTASDAMCTFLALNTSCITLLPATIIGVRVSFGSASPTEIVGACIFATACSTLIAITVDTWFRKWSPWRKRREHHAD